MEKLLIWIALIQKSMAESWKEAKDCAQKEALPQVYHDCDTNTYGACNTGEIQGTFKGGVFSEHRCLCMPAHLTAEELEAKEKEFRSGNPDW
jgi:hypothetical protein